VYDVNMAAKQIFG